MVVCPRAPNKSAAQESEAEDDADRDDAASVAGSSVNSNVAASSVEHTRDSDASESHCEFSEPAVTTPLKVHRRCSCT